MQELLHNITVQVESFTSIASTYYIQWKYGKGTSSTTFQSLYDEHLLWVVYIWT